MSAEIIHKNAVRAAGAYKRKCWWADYDDLYQTASLAQVEACRTFDESWGRPLAAYLWRAAILATRTAVHKASAPVSASHQTENLLGLYRDTLDAPHVQLESGETVEELFGEYERARRVRERVTVLVGEQAMEFALGVITDEWKPREVAQAWGVPAQRVYSEQQRLIGILAGDVELCELWREGNR